MSAPVWSAIHASCVLAGRHGILIRGASGTGKSALAFELIARSDACRAVRLVADDACRIAACNGRLVAAPQVPVAGLMELRGLGVVSMTHAGRCVVRLVVDLVPAGTAERLPGEADARISLEGIELPRLVLPAGAPAAPLRVLEVLAAAGGGATLPLLPEGAPIRG